MFRVIYLAAFALVFIALALESISIIRNYLK